MNKSSLKKELGYGPNNIRLPELEARIIINGKTTSIKNLKPFKEGINHKKNQSLHMHLVWQPRGKKEEVSDKEFEVPKFIEKKIKSA